MDDIDIEEHDVLDNPAIKCVFPDLSLLKQEINEYYNEEISIKEEQDAETTPEDFLETQDIINVCADSYFENTNTQKSQTFQSNLIISGSNSNAQQDTHNEVDTIFTVDFKPIKIKKKCSNKIIKNVKHVKLILQDIMSYLNQNERYCKICCRLFLSNKAFQAHSNNVHNKVIYNTKVKQTTGLPHPKCSICSVSFTRKANLIRHYRNIHWYSTTPKYRNMLIYQNRRRNAKHHIQSRHYCNKCNISFVSTMKLKRHHSVKHGPNITSMKTKPKDEKHKSVNKRDTTDAVAIPLSKKRKHEFTPDHLNLQHSLQYLPYCKLCCRLFASNHALIIHNSRAHKFKPIKTNAQFSCGMCGCCFANNSNLLRHYKNIHHNNMNKYICNICKSGFSTHYGFKRHCKNMHESKNIINTVSKSKRPTIDCMKDKQQLQQDSDALLNKKCEPSKAIKVNDVTCRNVLVSDGGKRRVILARKYQRNVDTVCSKTATAIIKESNQLVVGRITDDSVSTKENHKLTSDNQESTIIHAENTTSKNIKCQHCNKLFPDQRSLIEHMYHVLIPKKISNGDSDKLEMNGNKLKEKDENVLFVCRQCSYYLPTIETYFTHMNRNHKTQIFLEANREKFVALCKYCTFKSSSIATHNKHIHSYHVDLMFTKIENELIQNYKIDKKDRSENINKNVSGEINSFALENVLFECNRCNVCFLSSNIASDHKQHMNALVNWKCFTCRRILKLHDKEIHLKQHTFSKSLAVFTLDEACNVLYNCTKCAIHFTEKRYQEHYPNCERDTTDSTYCKICDILVDSIDWFHHKRHEHSGGISDFTIIESNIIIVDGTILEASDSELEVNTKVKKKEQTGTIRKQEDSEFESDLDSRLNLNEYTSIIQKRKSLDIDLEVGSKVKFNDPHNCLTYCPTCKCFHTDLGAKYKCHINGTCSVLKYVCNVCGLVLTHSVLALHKERHKKEKNLCLQDFKFFDLGGQQIRPPTPDYPYCDHCGIHFLRKNVIYTHICNKTDYLICDVCNIKLTKTAYKLHMSFHFYVVQKADIKIDKKSFVNESSKSQVTEKAVRKKLGTTVLINEQQIPNDFLATFLYSCRMCGISVNSYDDVVSHCQDHYSGTENQTSVNKCTQCSLTFDSHNFIDHQQRAHSGVSECNVLKFDPRHFTSKTTIWNRKVFRSVPDDVVNTILQKSMYRHEHRIKFKRIQESSENLFAFKCDKCGIFVDPLTVYKHTQNPCSKTKKYMCSFCDVPFSSNLSRNNHEKLHVQLGAFSKSSPNIILFNQAKDKMLNNHIFCSTNPHILYQCRLCSGVVEESMRTVHMCDEKTLIKCVTCGLLISKDDFCFHNYRHTYLGNFCSENFKVILFGRKNDNNEILKELSSSFDGAIYDYTLYKCNICKVCLKNKENHKCVENFELDKMYSTCSDCDLYFPSLTHHIKQHRTDAHFVRANMNIVTFNKRCLGPINENEKDNEPIKTNLNSDLDHNESCMIIEVSSNDYHDNYHVQNGVIGEHNYASAEEKSAINIKESGSDRDASKNQDNSNIDGPGVLYKCTCGLHFVNKQKITDHIQTCYPKVKQYKQNCSKCHLLFNQSELFSHLLAHHRGKSQVNDFKVIAMSMKDKE